jgi:hypothetical protein
MHGAAAVTRNSRRTGIPATIKGKPNAAYGPTAERLAKAQGHVSVGDDKRARGSITSTTTRWTACMAA